MYCYCTNKKGWLFCRMLWLVVVVQTSFGTCHRLMNSWVLHGKPCSIGNGFGVMTCGIKMSVVIAWKRHSPQTHLIPEITALCTYSYLQAIWKCVRMHWLSYRDLSFEAYTVTATCINFVFLPSTWIHEWQVCILKKIICVREKNEALWSIHKCERKCVRYKYTDKIKTRESTT